MLFFFGLVGAVWVCGVRYRVSTSDVSFSALQIVKVCYVSMLVSKDLKRILIVNFNRAEPVHVELRLYS